MKKSLQSKKGSRSQMAEEKPAFKISILASGSSGNSLYIESEKNGFWSMQDLAVKKSLP